MLKKNNKKIGMKFEKECQRNINSGAIWFCLPENYEVLTINGWIPFCKLNKEETVYSYNINQLKIEKTNIINIFKYKNINKFNLLKTNKQEIISTVNHNFLWTKNNKIFLKKCSDFKNIGSYGMISSGSQKNKEYNISDNELKLLAWILTDGTIYIRGGQKGYSIFIYQSQCKYFKRIENLLKKLNIKFTKNFRPKIGFFTKYQQYSYYLHNPLRLINKYELKIDKGRKIIPKWFFNLSERQVQVFLKEAILGDGHKGKTSTVIYGTHHFLSQLQSLLVINGQSCTLYKNNRKEYCLIIRKSKCFYFSNYKIRDNHKIKNFYCLENKNSTFIVRTPTGHVFISGNSKGDLSTSEYIIECKLTTKNGYRISTQLLEKLWNDALDANKLPKLIIGIQNPESKWRLTVDINKES